MFACDPENAGLQMLLKTTNNIHTHTYTNVCLSMRLGQAMKNNTLAKVSLRYACDGVTYFSLAYLCITISATAAVAHARD
jgi:hypothetical protein